MPSITTLYYFQTSYTGPSIEDSSGGRLPLLEGTVTGLVYIDMFGKVTSQLGN